MNSSRKPFTHIALLPALLLVLWVILDASSLAHSEAASISNPGSAGMSQSAQTCPPAMIVGTIGQGSLDYPSTSGTQTGRVSQNGVNSACDAPKTCPGIASPGSSFAYDAYQFQNPSAFAACVTFTFQNACGVNQAVHPVAYLGSFNPSSVCTNYLGDIGHSINASESDPFSVNIPAGQTITLVVHEVGTVPGCPNYSFSVTGLPGCTGSSCTITGSLGQGSANHPAEVGTQTSRVTQNGVNSSCAAPKTCPGLASLGSTFTYDAYRFQNTGATTACVTVTVPTACGVNQAIHPVAYLGGNFDPNNVCTNYLGDIGHSINAGESDSFSFNVPAGQIFTLVFHQTGLSPGCPNYNFTITGLPDCSSPLCSGITCPANITVSNTSGQCSAVVNYPLPTSNGACGTITCTPPPNSSFPIGTTTVNCSSTAGSSCTFTITVNDTQPPSITCPANVTALATSTTCAPATSKVVNYPSPTTSDNCAVASVVCSPPSGSIFPVGTTTITCTATDSSGNTATCSFTVSVFNGCLQDDSNSRTVVLFNTSSGDYRFCCNGTTFTGRGSVSQVGCIFTIQHNTLLRKVIIKIDFSAAKGSATLQSPPGTTQCTISDRNITDNHCQCN